MKSRAVSLLLAVLCVALSSSLALAQSPQITLRASQTEVEAGQTFSVQLLALVDEGEPLPRKPTLRVPPAFTAHGPSVATQTQISLSGGRFARRTGISASWTLQASRPGRYRIGPATVEISGRNMGGETLEIQVTPPGSRPPPKRFDPFDPFGFGFPTLPNAPFGSDEPGAEPELPPYPEELRVGQVEDPIAFLRAVAAPMRVVVGQQVTLTIYAYGARGPFREANTSEPSREAFLTHTLLENSFSETMYRVPINGAVWHAKKVRELALFPIRAGQLSIGSMRLGFEGRGYPSAGQHRGLARASEPVVIQVSEPPEAGRPTGYRLGDVGRFTLEAKPEPREITAGEAVSVVAKLEGTGNLPFVLKTPQRHGVRWLEPTQVDSIEPRGSVIGGWRKLTYVVHIDEPGEIDLGELTLPYWDPEREAYQVARAELGKIKVNPSSDKTPKAPVEPDALDGVLKLRQSLDAAPARPAHFTDSSWFWLALLLIPGAVVLTSTSTRGWQRARERIALRRTSHASIAQRALADASAAAAKKDVPLTAAAAERAIFAAIESATGLKARAVLRGDLEAELVSRDILADTAREVIGLLERCEQVRFTGDTSAATADEIVDRSSKLVRTLARKRTRSSPNGA